MARQSKYDNQNTPLSINVIQSVKMRANELNLTEIEAAQTLHGISDLYLAEIMGINKSQISRMKKGDSPVPSSGKIVLYLFLQYFAK